MPGKLHHQCLTRAALESAGILDAPRLIEEYSSYPDMFHDHYIAEIAPYMFIRNGVEFHYPPHTPTENFYRYWSHTAECSISQLTIGENENLRFSEAGFRFYLENTVKCLQDGARDDAWKFLGCLLHYLEDQSFGIHALEGPDGTDIYVLDRLSGKDFARYVCSIPLSEELAALRVTPEIFAANVPEAVALLYSRYLRTAADSRQALFDIALEYCTGRSQRTFKENEALMFRNTVQLAADTAATVAAIAAGTAPVVKERPLTAFTPFHYPIGGGGKFRLRRFEEKDNTITFGVNLESRLLYSIPDGVYRNFSADLYGNGIGCVQVRVIDHGREIRGLEVKAGEKLPLNIVAPGGDFGIVVLPISGSGEMVVENGVFAAD